MIQLINRRIYTERIAPFINKSIIKVLTGQRRVGKSYILRQIQNHIEQTQPDCNIISFLPTTSVAISNRSTLAFRLCK